MSFLIGLAKLSRRVVEDADVMVGAGVDALPKRKAAGLTQYSSQSLSEMVYQSLSDTTLKTISR